MNNLNNLLTKARIVAAADGSAEVQDLYQQVEEAVMAGKSMTSALHYNALLEAAGADDEDVEQVASELTEQPAGYDPQTWKPRKKNVPTGTGPYAGEPKPMTTGWPWESLDEQGDEQGDGFSDPPPSGGGGGGSGGLGVTVTGGGAGGAGGGLTYDFYTWDLPGGGHLSLRGFAGIGGGGSGVDTGVDIVTVDPPIGDDFDIEVPYSRPWNEGPGLVMGAGLHGSWDFWGK
jgi:hypothetical protein